MKNDDAGQRAPEERYTEQGFSVFQVSDYEWYAARSQEEAVACALKDWGYTSVESAAEDGCFDPEQVDCCDLDKGKVQTSEPGEKPVTKVTFRELLKENIEFKRELPGFFCGTEY